MICVDVIELAASFLRVMKDFLCHTIYCSILGACHRLFIERFVYFMLYYYAYGGEHWIVATILSTRLRERRGPELGDVRIPTVEA